MCTESQSKGPNLAPHLDAREAGAVWKHRSRAPARVNVGIGYEPLIHQPPITMHTTEFTRSIKWTPAERKAARAILDAELSRDLGAIRANVEGVLRTSTDSGAVWTVHDYLTETREQIDWKYDYRYRYSGLMTVLGRLYAEGWISEAELSTLGAEKAERVTGSRMSCSGRTMPNPAMNPDPHQRRFAPLSRAGYGQRSAS